jgi:hypothetical protein
MFKFTSSTEATNTLLNNYLAVHGAPSQLWMHKLAVENLLSWHETGLPGFEFPIQYVQADVKRILYSLVALNLDVNVDKLSPSIVSSLKEHLPQIRQQTLSTARALEQCLGNTILQEIATHLGEEAVCNALRLNHAHKKEFCAHQAHYKALSVVSEKIHSTGNERDVHAFNNVIIKLARGETLAKRIKSIFITDNLQAERKALSRYHNLYTTAFVAHFCDGTDSRELIINRLYKNELINCETWEDLCKHGLIRLENFSFRWIVQSQNSSPEQVNPKKRVSDWTLHKLFSAPPTQLAAF